MKRPSIAPAGGARRGGILLGVALAMSMVTGLAGCGDGADAHVPADVQAMMEAPFPADGQIHVQARGRFEIKPDTMVCRAERDIDPAFKKTSPRFLGPGLGSTGSAASSGVSGRLGEDMSNGTRCVSNGINVINKWVLSLNREGEPYKLVLAVWQGAPGKGGAVWVGGVERPYEIKLPPGSAIGPGRTYDGKPYWDRNSDAYDLSREFVVYLSGKGMKHD